MSQRKKKRKRRAARTAHHHEHSYTLFDMFHEQEQKQGASPPVSPTPTPDTTHPPGARHASSGLHLLEITLPYALWLYVWELFEQGGPHPFEIEDARAFGRVLASKGDLLLYRSSKPGETADLFDRLAHASAVLAYNPGGFPLFGDKPIEAEQILAGRLGAEAAKEYISRCVERYYQQRPMEVSASIGLLSPRVDLGQWNVIRWFERASDADLLQIRAEGYSNLLPGVQSRLCQECRSTRVLDEALQQARQVVAWAKECNENDRTDNKIPSPAQAQQILMAHEQGQDLVCCIDPIQANAWLFFFKHTLLYGNKQT